MSERKTFHQMDGSGNIQEINCESGEVVNHSNKVVSLPKTSWIYNHVIADIICQRIADGSTLTKICLMDGFPGMGVIVRWRSQEDLFDEALRYAEAARAERFHDKIVSCSLIINPHSEMKIRVMYRWLYIFISNRYCMKLYESSSLIIFYTISYWPRT